MTPRQRAFGCVRPGSGPAENAAYVFPEGRQVPLDHHPYRVEIDPEIAVNEPVASAGYLLPRYPRLALRQLGAQVFYGFADDLELADDRALHHVVREERLAAAGGKAFDRRDASSMCAR